MEDTFINKIDTEEKINTIFDNTDKNTNYFTQISDKVVTAYTNDLDALMNKIREDTIDNTPSDEILEKYVLELSNLLYFLGTRLETVGIKDDITRMSAKEVYNNTYTDNLDVAPGGKKPTVAELNVMSENASRYETVVNSIYSRVYRQIKFKIDGAYEMLASLRKIVSKRMQENQLSYTRNSGSVVIGSEEF
nr:MAG TPA: hypothetical protein [Caudoviricetes sp.]